MVAEAFSGEAPKEADVEDLFDADILRRLAEAAYASELAGRALVLNASIPRIVPRFEQAFAALGITFHKSRVAKRFLDQMGKDPTTVLDAAAVERFERLLVALGSAVSKVESAGREPFR